MALDLKVQYPSQVDTGNPSYPYGQPRNVSAPAATDGTPWEAALVRDIYGFLQKMIQDAGLTPSGNPDSALASQYLDAMELLFLNRTELRENGGVVLHDGDAKSGLEREGLAMVYSTGVVLAINEGVARDAADATDIPLLAQTAKDISVSWTLGDAGGCQTHALAQGWTKVHLVSTPGGVVDWCIDQSNTAANFFANANAIAAGFSDNTLRRRIGWLYIDAPLTLLNFRMFGGNPLAYEWATPVMDIDVVGLPDALRLPFTVAHAPPDSTMRAQIFGKHSEAAQYLMSRSFQSDIVPSVTAYTLRMDGSPFEASHLVDWQLDGQNIRVRRSAAGTVSAFQVRVLGWLDDQSRLT